VAPPETSRDVVVSKRLGVTRLRPLRGAVAAVRLQRSIAGTFAVFHQYPVHTAAIASRPFTNAAALLTPINLCSFLADVFGREVRACKYGQQRIDRAAVMRSPNGGDKTFNDILSREYRIFITVMPRGLGSGTLWGVSVGTD
jgi:hypothetical protein